MRIAQDVPTSSSEAQSLLLDNTSGTFSQFNNISSVSFVVENPPLANGSHTFTLSNANPLSLRFNWSLQLDYSRVADHLELSIDGLPSPLYVVDNLTTGVELQLGPALFSILGNSTLATPGPPGVTFTRVTLRIHSTSEGRVQLANLDIRYQNRFSAGGLADAFESIVWASQADLARVDVPVRVYSPGPTTLYITSADVLYDRPPLYFGFPTTEGAEDVPLLFDLNTVFHDDFDNANLTYTFTTPGGSANATVAIVARYNLSITPKPDVSGTITINVTATDSGSLRNSSGPVTFSFQPVNDAPRLLISQLNVTWGTVSTVDLTPFMEDPDTPIAQASITSATGGPVSISARRLIFNLSSGAPDFSLNLTLTDGISSANASVLVHPRASDTPPALQPIPSIEFSWDGAYRMDLSLYTSDAEDSLAELSFYFTLTAGNASALLWTTETDGTTTYLKLIPRPHAGGNFTGVLIVTDLDGNANSTTLGLRIVAPANRPPSIVGVPPSLALGADPFSLALATKWSDGEDQTPGELAWTVSAEAHDLFAVVYDPNSQLLQITPTPGKSGVGTVTLTLRDSGGLTDTQTIDVSVDAPATGGLDAGTAALMLSLVFAAIVLLAALSARRGGAGSRPAAARRKSAKELGALSSESPVTDEPEPSEVGDFLRGHTESPAVVPLVPTAAEEPAAPAATPAAAPARLGELYVIGLSDGAMVFQEPARNLSALGQADENRLLQWAFDTARDELDRAGDTQVAEWEGQAVLLARGETFLVAGRVEGTDPDALLSSVRTLVVEVDHEFPGSPNDWQRADILDTVTDILRRLVQ